MVTPWVSFDGKDCSGCKHLNERGYCEFTGCIIPCTMRATIPEVKPLTNADCVRSMTDEELAEWLSHHSMVCVPGKRPNPEDCVGGCEHCWLDWLKEVNDGKEEKEENQPAK